jgi:tripartite-type tricarboxylate transporter receptor subunit TctC
LPTIAESGLPGYDIGEWWGVLVHGKTPKDLVARWNQEILKALGDPEVQSRLTQLGADLVGNSPSEFDAFIRSQMKKWNEVIKQAGIKQS